MLKRFTGGRNVMVDHQHFCQGPPVVLCSPSPPPLVLLHQVLKRFTGGGTVVVDHDTIFATLIVQVSSLWVYGLEFTGRNLRSL